MVDQATVVSASTFSSSSSASSPAVPSPLPAPRPLPARSARVQLLDETSLWFSYLARLSVTVAHQPSAPAVHWVECNSGSSSSPLPTLRVSESLSYGELWHEAVLLAAHLRSPQYDIKVGDRVLLIFPFTSLDFIVAFFACLLHGCIPCPTYPPDPTRFAATIPTMARLARHVGARHALSSSQYMRWKKLSALQPRVKWPSELTWINCSPARQAAHDQYRANQEAIGRLQRSLFKLGAFNAARGHPSPSATVPSGGSNSAATHPTLPPAVIGAYECALRSVQASVREPTSLAFIQQTSGSTSDPKAVCVHHTALNDNIGQQSLSNRTAKHVDLKTGHVSHISAVMFTWLPAYHDMGLIYAHLLPLQLGGSVYTMSPLDFIRSPLSWVMGMSQFGATMSAAPNFAWDLVVRRYTALPVSQRPKLRLSQMEFLISGAERIHHDSLVDFLAAFGPSGFKESTIATCYGMAETVVAVAYNLSTTITLNKASPHLVSCGSQFSEYDTEVMIVKPALSNSTSEDDAEEGAETAVRVCGENEVGDIWVSSFAMAAGYWNDPVRTQSTYGNRAPASAPSHLRLHPDGVTPRSWLATGDMGCLEDGHLYITGRSKELIILNGRNLYPVDIEHSLQDIPELRRGCCVALGLTADEAHRSRQQRSKAAAKQDNSSQELAALRTEQLVVLVEVREERKMSKTELSAIANRILDCISVEHGQQVGLLCILKPKTLLKTTSGKLKRVAARQQCVEFAFTHPPLFVVDQSDVSDNTEGAAAEAGTTTTATATTARTATAASTLPPWDPSADCAERERLILSVIVLLVAEHSTSSTPAQQSADADCLWGECGVDSMHSMLLLSSLQRWLKAPVAGTTQPEEYDHVSVMPSLLYEYPSFRQLAQYLARLDAVEGAVEDPPHWNEARSDMVSVTIASDEYSVTGGEGMWAKSKDFSSKTLSDTGVYGPEGCTLESDSPVSSLQYWMCGVAQVLALSGFWCWFLLSTSYCFHLLSLLSAHVSVVALLACVPFVFAGECVALCLSVIGVKWLLLGRVRPGRYRAWGGYFFRWWVVHTYSAWLHMLFLHLFRNTWMYRCWLAAMGMKGAFSCAVLDSIRMSTVDMISVHGDSVIVEGDVTVSPHYLHGQHLVIQRIHIQARAHLTHHSVVQTTITLTQPASDSLSACVPVLPKPIVIAAGTTVRPTDPLPQSQRTSFSHKNGQSTTAAASTTTATTATIVSACSGICHGLLKACADACQVYGHCLLVVVASCVVYEVVLRVVSAWSWLPSELVDAALSWGGSGGISSLGASRAYVSVLFLLGPQWLTPFLFWLARPELAALSMALGASSMFSWFQHSLLLTHYVIQLVFVVTLGYLVYLLSTAVLLVVHRRCISPVTALLLRLRPQSAVLQLLDGMQQGVFSSSIRQWTLQQCFVWMGTAGQIWMLRALGADIGSQVVVADTVTWTHPERIHVDDRAFIGDLSSLQPVSYAADVNGVRPQVTDIRVGRSALVGMRATVQHSDASSSASASASATPPSELHLVDNCLLGAGSRFDSATQQSMDKLLIPDSTTQSIVVFGKHVTSTTLKAEAQIQRWPLWYTVLYGCVWPVVISVVELFMVILTLLPTATASLAVLSNVGYWPAAGVNAALGWLLWSSAVVWLVLCKWLLMGRFSPSQHSIASLFFLRRLVFNHALAFCRCCGMELWQCTPLLPAMYRALGATIGSRCLLQSNSIIETDLLHVGDRAAINQHAVLFGHVVERGQMTTDAINIGDDCTVDGSAVLLCGSTLGHNTHLLHQSVVMKGQNCGTMVRDEETGSSSGGMEQYSGIPASRVSRVKL